MDKRFLYYSNGQPVEVPKKVFDALVESDNKIRYFEHDLKVELTVRRKGQRITLPTWPFHKAVVFTAQSE